MKRANNPRQRKPSVRDRYNWHLRSPFEREFDHSHWWKNTDTEIDPAAALYELARRHPRVGELRHRFRRSGWYGQELRDPLVGATKKRMASQAFADLGQEPAAIHCLCLIGLKTWPRLDARNQDYWLSSAGSMKGVDCRDDVEKCYSISLEAFSRIVLKRASSLGLPRRRQQCYPSSCVGSKEATIQSSDENASQDFDKILVRHLLDAPISPSEMDTAIAENATHAHQGNCWIIAVAPDLAQEEAERLMSEVYRKHRQMREMQVGAGKQRSRHRQWLKVISDFESAEASNRGANARGFNPYKAIVDGISFDAGGGAAFGLIPPG